MLRRTTTRKRYGRKTTLSPFAELKRRRRARRVDQGERPCVCPHRRRTASSSTASTISIRDSRQECAAVCTMFPTLIPDRRKSLGRLKKAGLFGIYVSLEHPDPKQHDTNRGRPGLAEKAFEGAEALPAGGHPHRHLHLRHQGKTRLRRDGRDDGPGQIPECAGSFHLDVVPTGRDS